MSNIVTFPASGTAFEIIAVAVFTQQASILQDFRSTLYKYLYTEAITRQSVYVNTQSKQIKNPTHKLNLVKRRQRLGVHILWFEYMISF